MSNTLQIFREAKNPGAEGAMPFKGHLVVGVFSKVRELGGEQGRQAP